MRSSVRVTGSESPSPPSVTGSSPPTRTAASTTSIPSPRRSPDGRSPTRPVRRSSRSFASSTRRRESRSSSRSGRSSSGGCPSGSATTPCSSPGTGASGPSTTVPPPSGMTGETSSGSSSSSATSPRRRQAELPSERAKEYAESIVATVREPLLVLDATLHVRSANRSFYETFRVDPGETDGRFIYDLGDGQWDIPALRTLLEEIVPGNSAFDDFEVEHDFEHLGRRTMLLNARRFPPEGEYELVLLAIEDVTDRRRMAREMASSEVRYRRLFEAAHDGILLVDPDDATDHRREPVHGRAAGLSPGRARGQGTLGDRPAPRRGGEPGGVPHLAGDRLHPLRGPAAGVEGRDATRGGVRQQRLPGRRPGRHPVQHPRHHRPHADGAGARGSISGPPRRRETGPRRTRPGSPTPTSARTSSSPCSPTS